MSNSERSRIARLEFIAHLAKLNAVLLSEWQGSRKPNTIRCTAGHITSPRPTDVMRGQGICQVCAGNSPAAAEIAFKARLSAIGATLLESSYLGSGKPHRVRCAAGHICAPQPDSLQRGRGICRSCAFAWDCFYIVRDNSGNVKFGITSHDARPRLTVHARDGYTEIVLLWTSLPDDYALSTEQLCKDLLRDARIKPIRGEEYYPPEALPILMSLERVEYV